MCVWGGGGGGEGVFHSALLQGTRLTEEEYFSLSAVTGD